MGKIQGCGELSLGNTFRLRIKSKVYCCCIRSTILYGSEAWCSKNEKAILRKMERAMVRAMCSQKVVERKTNEEQRDMLRLKKL